jgi:hypothetical protein
MPSLNQHIEDCYNILGDSFIEVHQWLDEFSKIYFPLKIHRIHRHHKEGIEQIRKMYGEKASKAAMIHILSDEGEILNEKEIRKKYKMTAKKEIVEELHMKIEIPEDIIRKTGAIDIARVKWNQSADLYNRWDSLGLDEKIELIQKELEIENTELAERVPTEVTGAEFTEAILIYGKKDKI